MSVTTAKGGPGYGSHNYIINGAFDVWQRGTSFASPSLGAYSADRWLNFISGGDRTISRQTFTPAELNVASFGDAKYYLRWNCTTSGVNVLKTLIEDVQTLAGQTVTLSFWAKASASRTIFASWYQQFGSGGSASVNGAALTLTTISTSWARYSGTFTLPSISGKTIGTSSHLQLDFDLSSATGQFDIWGIQLEAGSVATPFKRHAPSLQGELAACQRYYWRAGYNSAYGGQLYNYPFLGTGVATTSSSVQVVMPVPVPMRLAPTSLDLLAASSYVLTDGASNFTASSISIDIYGFTGYNSVCLNVGTSGLTAGKTYFLRSQFGSNAYIGVNGGEL